ncbi:uncharacterized protein LOC131530497 isoform X2 [Onychostoma macrolepis]|uniref:Immunoglobulin domain-containing protein n=1 Tax=Onychostoma macrolepis TaxID=369639 RepID=A0A7J6BQB6_9TELE|nr:uncharacterized protein LOC131530497 isoform X2 [Onychostoma macrolepis]KAF4097208.1 hypothetical protein G5714_021216 [Onychostoma macrolepis]
MHINKTTFNNEFNTPTINSNNLQQNTSMDHNLFLVKAVEMKLLYMLPWLWCLLDNDVSGVYTDGVSLSVMEGDPVTLNTSVETNPQDKIRWSFNNIRLAEITGDQSWTCTDEQCNNSDGRFRDRLSLDHQTGSLTIKNTKTTDSGVYKLKIMKNTRDHEKIFIVFVNGFFSVDTEEVSLFVMEGDSVTLQTDVETNQQEKIRWYFNDIRIAQITGDQTNICTDVQCKNSTERFRDRLNLENQTGSLTIMNIRITDTGVYRLRIIGSSNSSETIFIVAVYGVPAAEIDKMKRKSVKEGGSLTLDPGVTKNSNDSVTWYFNDILIAEITGDQSKICTGVQCEDADERFRDRLKLNHQTGSLTIMNTRTTDSGDYKLQINSIRISVMKIFSVNVTAVLDSTMSSGAKGGINAAVAAAVVAVLLVAAAGVIYLRRWRSTHTGQYDMTHHNHDQQSGMALH